MKRFLILALLAAFALSAGVANAATTLKTSGEMAFAFMWHDNLNMFDSDGDNQSEDDFRAAQRVRVFFDWAASEALRGVVGLEMGTSAWGASGAGADLDADDSVIEVKWAYLDFKWPNSNLSFRVGVQPLELPWAVAGNPVFGADVAGILATYKFNDNVSATLGWLRAQDGDSDGVDSNTSNSLNDEIDVMALLLPIKGDGWNFTPWAAMAMVGNNATTNANTNVERAYYGLVNNATGVHDEDLNAYWVGGAFTLSMFAPFTIKSDLIYGWTDGASDSVGDRAGYFFDLAVDYKMDMVTPGIFFVYSSGEDDDAKDSERMPVMYNSSGFRATSFGFGGASSVLGDWDGQLSNTATGLMVIGAQLKDFSFVDKLTHTVRVAYGQGTSDEDYVKKGLASQDFKTESSYPNGYHGVVLTDKDSFWEVNFDSKYSIYENLTAYVEMGWIKVDLDDIWKGHTTPLGTKDPDKTEDMWKLAFCLKYSF